MMKQWTTIAETEETLEQWKVEVNARFVRALHENVMRTYDDDEYFGRTRVFFVSQVQMLKLSEDDAQWGNIVTDQALNLSQEKLGTFPFYLY
jgi:hypothetical protein